jgi:molybdopterin synthase sulfur carrier subunit
VKTPIRVALPYHLRNLARVEGELRLEVEVEVGGGGEAGSGTGGRVTLGAILDALEARYPVLRGTIREHGTLRRRPFIRFFACREDWSLEPPGTPVPEAVARGEEPLLIVGAMAGG